MQSRPMTEPSTPLMRQYAAIKKQHPNALLFFRLGDFYELFFEDAVVAARELQITLTSRNKEKEHAIPMCGVPYHAAEELSFQAAAQGLQGRHLRADGRSQRSPRSSCAARSRACSRPGRRSIQASGQKKTIFWRPWRVRPAAVWAWRRWIFPPANSAPPRFSGARRRAPHRGRAAAVASARGPLPFRLPLFDQPPMNSAKRSLS